ncbi:hypothetical protein BDA99DRAFT_541347 [Phascolomyces articulosus]|uniref:Heterokaryon incompatibility domain-containing protein n=1 Tax=Phascolomyces articulosus TaxID=60185 RepID=A0AAD5K1R4_9FUNG|nr:hypothetical protein BDA99DRAFT_541347 [Phascolomyces articulosus]
MISFVCCCITAATNAYYFIDPYIFPLVKLKKYINIHRSLLDELRYEFLRSIKPTVAMCICVAQRRGARLFLSFILTTFYVFIILLPSRSAAVNQVINETMYITYETAQSFGNVEYELTKRVKPPITVPNDLPKPDFMPTKLVRISDMKVVNGSQVNEGYCALSYSWNQSGDIKQDDNRKYVRVDDGEHKIISYDNIFPDMIIPNYKMPIEYEYKSIETWSKMSKMYHVLKIIDNKNYHFTKTTKHAKFEPVIQQICQQFNIKYIWYDQLCINQNNKKEKQREIRNMHQIYENAYCAVALVPEYARAFMDFRRSNKVKKIIICRKRYT